MNRRDFLSVSATAAGGLLLGFSLGCKGSSSSNKTEDTAALEGADLRAWIHIDPDDTVTMRIAHSEMGQGIMTSLSMILAEELDADWTKVRCEHAPADEAKYGDSLTGGSGTIREGWAPMKKAGAQARAMLVAAAAKKLGVPADELTTDASVITHAASKRTLRYGEVVAAAATETPPEQPVYKAPERYHLVGKPTKRLDTRAKITGQAVYGLDVKLPGMLVAQVAHAPVLGAKPAKVDDARARAIPGVRDVVTISTGVAVIADHFWAAKQGREALVIEWDGGDVSLSSSSISTQLAGKVDAGAEARKDGDRSNMEQIMKPEIRNKIKANIWRH